MNIKDVYGNNCPTLYALKIISGKWRIPILWKMHKAKVIRFNELKREVTGITNMVLSQCLQELEEAHIIFRKQYEEIPPRVEYSLTEDGKRLVQNLDKFRDWGNMMFEKHLDILEHME